MQAVHEVQAHQMWTHEQHEAFRQERGLADADFSMLNDGLALEYVWGYEHVNGVADIPDEWHWNVTANNYPPPEATPHEIVEWVANSINNIAEGLEAAGLPYHFARVYGALTKEILKNLDKFTYKADLAKTAVIFFDYFRDPVRGMAAYAQGDDEALQTVNESWWLTIMDDDVQDAEPGVQFLLGMWAHITDEDLMESLGISEPSNEYYQEYTLLVNKMINNTTKRYGPELIPGHPACRKLAAWLVVKVITSIREQAYRNYQLQQGENEDAFSRAKRLKEVNKQAARGNNVILAAGRPTMRMLRATEWLPGGRSQQSADEEMSQAA